MHNNVFAYLSGKTQDVTNYIKTKAEAAGNYLREHAKQIKNGAIKATATALTAATLLVGATGCGLFSNETKFPIVSVKPFEEIQEQGITAQDVLNLYDYYSLQHLYHYLDSAQGYLNFDKLSAQFEHITVDNFNGGAHPEPFFHNMFSYPSWDNGYFVGFYYDAAYGKKSETTYKSALIPQVEFEDLMKVFNVKSFELTDEYWANNPQEAENYGYRTEDIVYEPFVFSRETIQNANEEQLWALYNVGIQITKRLENIIEQQKGK